MRFLKSELLKIVAVNFLVFLTLLVLAEAIGRDVKGKISPLIYVAAIPLAYVSPWIANGLYVVVALMWLVPDRRIEKVVKK